MTCDEFEAIVDDIPTEGSPLSAEAEGHLAGCPRCRMVLAVAQGVEHLLREPGPPAPAGFTAAVQRRVQRDRWRMEQIVDSLFNGVLGVGAVFVAVGLWLFVNSGRTAAFFQSVVDAMRREDWTTAATLPHVWAYVGCTLLVITAATMWWWMDREDAL